MDKYFKWKVLIIILVTAFCGWKAYPPAETINLGLDLQGGMQLLLEVDIEKIPEEAREDATDRVVEVIRNRIDEFGVQEPVIQKQGSTHVVVQLPGVTDRERAKDIVGKTAHLEFKLVSSDSELLDEAEKGNVPDGYELKTITDQLGTNNVLLESDAVLTGDRLTTASVGFDQYGQPIVQLQFDSDGAKIFDQVTFENVGKQLAIVLDGRVHSAPVIRDRISGGQAQISGNFTVDEASDLSLVLRAGSLPAPVRIIEERTVGASLGRDSVNKGIKAALIGALLVFVFMPLYYLFSGFIADVGLIIYAVLVLGAFAAIDASLTLPGIAGFILSLGMAVDANVLIFERIREEMDMGKSSRGAVSAGYHKAFTAILDSNVTTLMTSLILFTFGTGPIKGFAATLSIGIVASLFSALVVTRVMFDFIMEKNPNLKLKMFNLVGETHIPFLNKRIFAYGFSVIALIIGIVSFLARGHENYGVEFTGGTLAHFEFEQNVEMIKLRDSLEADGIKGAVIQRFGSLDENQFIIKTQDKDTGRLESVASKLGGPEGYKILRVDRIGPTVSQDLTKKALLSLFWACIGILIYLGWRFEWKFAAAAVFALLHDTVFTFGIYALLGREINIPTVAAILTIIGYSVNDTIVTFDRVRDNLKIMKRKPFSEVVNASINQTLGRTVMTSATTILAALSLFIFGGSAINDFALILLIGFAVGTYSTIFVATSIAVDWKAKAR